MDTIRALKTGNMDNSQKSSYHCSRKGHIKENCPNRKKLGARSFQITAHQPPMVLDEDLKVAEACAQLLGTQFCAKDMTQQMLEENL